MPEPGLWKGGQILGRKVHPYGFRLGITKDWKSHWYADGRRYNELLIEDEKIRAMLQKELEGADLEDVFIARYPQQVHVTVRSAKPGVVIGKSGANVKALRQRLIDFTGKKVKLDIEEVKRPELSATLVARSIASQLERRISYRRAMRQAIGRAMRGGAQGIMIACAGRLAGAEMARRELMREGRVPRHMLRADIDYAQAEALTTFGRIGVKVWIYRGDILPEKPRKTAE